MEVILDHTLLQEYITTFTQAFIDYSPRLLSAIILFFVGTWAIKLVNRFSRKIMVRRAIEPTLIEFLSDIVYWGLRIVLFIAVISKLGVPTSSFLALLGAAGLAIGLSLQGSLSNFAGGMLIILFKPFKLGDTIEAQGIIGTVSDIQIFVTQLVTANNQVIFIPNGALSNSNIINYSVMENRRTDLTLGISYETNIQLTKDLIVNILNNNPKVLKDPVAAVVVKELTDSGIKIAIRAWAKNEDFFDVSATILEDCKNAFDAANIAFQPYVRERSVKGE